MKEISDLKIIGIDESRPPVIRKEPYIELYFKLSHEAPKELLQEFNDQTSGSQYPIKIKPESSLFVETWVRTTDEIEPVFEYIKAAIHACIENYHARIKAQKDAVQAAASGIVLSDAQIKLNEIISKLKFESED
ncbi:MAG: hypothetical protein OQK51_05675 [Kangiellaceae bacterium]|nr:hypothetical protein [Kangiellaceae bacterium]